MAPRVIFTKCPEMLKSRNRLDTFQGCRMHFLPKTFFEIAVY